MKKVKHLSAITILAIGSLLIMVGRVDATPYSFSVDRFHVVGNLPGDIVDEFDDGVLDPWNIQVGTAVESGGVVTFSDPGEVADYFQDNLHVTQERSSVEVEAATGVFAVADGSGDFVVESRWLTVLPDLNLGYGMTFHYPPSEFDQVWIGIYNLEALALPLLGAPAGTVSGSYISFIRISPGPGTGLYNLTFEYQAVPVVASDITGDIVFRLLFDDTANSFSATYSLDGGSTFLQPFSPFSIPSLTGPIEPFMELGAWCLTAEPSAAVEVDIDIKPGSFPNSINPKAGGVIPVAILTTADFDASTIDPQTVALEGAGARSKGKSGRYGSMEDVDGDGDLDLVVQIDNDIEWDPEATEATLTGETYDGIAIQGMDTVNIVPPE
jgi:hypothetical protein